MSEVKNLSYAPVPGTGKSVRSLLDLLELRAAADNGRAAYTFLSEADEHGISISYKELDLQARRIAARLAESGHHGERALLLYAPGLEFLSAFFGCLYAGVIAVPAYPPHRNRNLLRLQAVIRDARPKFVLTTAGLLPKIEKGFAELANGPHELQLIATDLVEAEDRREYANHEIRRDTVAFLQYTSGSTGNPKGVILTHENLLHNAALVNHAVEHAPGDSYVSWLPVFHDMGFMAGVLQPLYGGLPCVQMAPAAFLENPIRWLKAISKFRGSTSGGPNFAYELCARKITEADCDGLDLSSWTVAFNGAEPVRADTMERFAARFERYGFNKSVFYPCYGLAEATLMVSGSWKKSLPVVLPIDKKSLERGRAFMVETQGPGSRDLVGSGHTLPDQELAIVDPSSLQPCAQDAVGEIWVKGPSMAAGYWKRSAESQETFQAYIAGTEKGPYLRTGDLGFIKDGELFVTGRLKDLLIIRGQNHYPQDIELTVEQCDRCLRAGSGAAFSAEIRGEERLVIVQEAVSQAGLDLDRTIQSIYRAVAETHELLPYAVVLIRAGSIPKTSSGKIQRRACKAAFLKNELHALKKWEEPDEAAHGAPLSPETSEPGPLQINAASEWLISIISRRLSIEPSAIDRNQPLTSYGLDSLTAVELVHHLQSQFGIDLPLSGLFSGATLAEIDQYLAGAAPAVQAPNGARKSQTYPLSFGQSALWFLYQLAPDSDAYNIARAVRINSEIDPAMFHRCFQTLSDRHPCLRTRFGSVNGEPRQTVQEDVKVAFEHFLIDAWSDEQLSRELTAQSRKPFDLQGGPVLRVRLYTQSAERHVLHIAVHHIVADFWSLMLLLEEIGKLYSHYSEGGVPQLPAPQHTYADFVGWQRSRVAQPEGEDSWSHWKRELSSEFPRLTLPADRSRQQQRDTAASHAFALDDELLRQLKKMSAEAQVSLFTTLLTAFQVFLHRISGHKDIVVGVPSAGRSRAEFASVFGYFVNPLPVHTDFHTRRTFSQVLAQVRETWVSALRHEWFPFPLMVEKLGIARSLDTQSVFQTMFVFHQTYGEHPEDLVRLAVGAGDVRIRLGKLLLEPLPVEQESAQFDLVLTVGEGSKGLQASFTYNSALFEPDTVARWARSFVALLRSAIVSPETLITCLPILDKTEHKLLVEEFNRRELAYDREQTVHARIAEQARMRPEAVAVRHGEGRTSYKELNVRANQIARYLQRLGAGRESIVAVCLQRTPELIAAMLGIWKAGAAYLPLDPQYPQERLGFMLADAGAQVVITLASLRERVNGTGAAVLCLDEIAGQIEAESGAEIAGPIESANLAYLIYTSGSTGVPKGVMLAHQNAISFVRWAETAFTRDELSGVLAATSICFDLSVFELWAALSCGGTVILVDGVLSWCEGLRDGRDAGHVRLINTVPSAMTQLIEQGLLPESVQTVNLAGEALGHALVQSLHQTRKLRVNNLYGPTETTTYSTATEVGPDEQITIGAGVANTKLYVLDDDLQLASLGVPGELYIGGPGVARGYWRHPDWTAERFLPDPFGNVAGARIYRTGDLVRWRKDGQLEYLGRKDQQVKVRGYRIELEEISIVLGQSPAVKENVVVAAEIAGEKQLVAYVALKPGMSVSAEDLRQFLLQRLPAYMAPASIVVLDSLPKTANGKIDRKSLPQADQNEVRGRGPQSEMEEMVAAIWAQALGLENISVEDDFFALGGHSLLALKIMARIEEKFKVRLPLRQLFESSSVRAMADAIEQQITSRVTLRQRGIATVDRRGRMPLSYAQQRLWFLDQLRPGTPIYNLPLGIQISGPLDSALAERALEEIVRRHEPLRTIFPAENGQPEQVVLPPGKIYFQVSDLSAMPEHEAASALKQIQSREAATPFDLQNGPLVRTHLVRQSQDQHCLIITLHHIIADGASLELVFDDFAQLYGAAAENVSKLLPAPHFHYADYASWQRECVQSEALDGDSIYWRKQLQGCVGTPELPTDKPRGLNYSPEAGIFAFQIPEDAVAKLQQLARGSAASLFMVLLAGFNILLARLSGRDDIAIGIPVSNRPLPEVERLLGMFVNTLVLRNRVSGDDTFIQFLGRIRETALDAYAHRELPFEKVVEDLQPERDLAYTPFFQVMLAFQHSRLEERESCGLRMRPFLIDNTAGKFDLTLFIEKTESGLSGAWQYRRDLFEEATVRRWHGYLEQVLAAVTANPDLPVYQSPLMSELERRQVLKEFNQTAHAYEHFQCLCAAFEQQAELHPDQTAISWGWEEVTYRALNAQANGLANALIAAGVQAEDFVAICLRRTPRMVAAILGVWKAGAAYVPLDPHYPSARLQFMLADSQAGIVITEGELEDRVTGGSARTLLLDRDALQETEENPRIPIKSAGAAYVIYTSGSTGTPKGVVLEHRNAMLLVNWARHNFSAEELSGVLASTSICFDLSIFELWAPLCCGGTVVLANDVLSWWEQVRAGAMTEQQTKLVNTVPSAIAQLIERGPLPEAVRTVNLAGEALPPSLVNALYESGTVQNVNNLYGPTETTTYSSWGRIDHDGPVTIGRPVWNSQLYVLDRKMQPVPPRVTGELYIAGDGVARGYWGRPDWTAERFLPDPFSSSAGARMYRTGDFVRWRPDGQLEYLGRSDHQVKVRGYRIEVEEIEVVLSSFEGVKEAAVMVREDGSDKRLVAYAAVDPGAPLSADQIKEYLEERLPRYMVPAQIVLLQSLPRTPNGKLDRHALPHYEHIAASRKPRTETEETIAQIWAEVLQVSEVGIDQNFFELGGHSLLATQVIARIEKRFQLRLPLSGLFESPTVVGVARMVESGGARKALPPIKRLPRTARKVATVSHS